MDMRTESAQNITFSMPRTLYDKNGFVLDFESACVVFSNTHKMRDFLTDSTSYTKDEIDCICAYAGKLRRQKKIPRRTRRIVAESGHIADQAILGAQVTDGIRWISIISAIYVIVCTLLFLFALPGQNRVAALLGAIFWGCSTITARIAMHHWKKHPVLFLILVTLFVFALYCTIVTIYNVVKLVI